MVFYLINIIKTRQNFFDNKIFEVLPNITLITNVIDITDEFLVKIFKLTSNDLIGYEKYIKSGEGRLDEKTITDIKHFKLDINNNIVKQITEEMQDDIINVGDQKTIKPKQTITLKKKSSIKVKNTGGKNTRKQKSRFIGGLRRYTRKNI